MSRGVASIEDLIKVIVVSKMAWKIVLFNVTYVSSVYAPLPLSVQIYPHRNKDEMLGKVKRRRFRIIWKEKKWGEEENRGG